MDPTLRKHKEDPLLTLSDWKEQLDDLWFVNTINKLVKCSTFYVSL